MSKEKRMESEYQSGRSLPEDLEKKILSKLPVRSLIRFKCVSKKWSSLITADSLFINSHLEHQYQFNSFTLLFLRPKNIGLDLSNQNCTSTRLMFLRDESNAVELDKSHILIHIYDRELCIYDMTVFRNGLVCLLASTFLKSWITILWNPATREFRELPEPNLHVDGILIHDISINSGFDPHNKDYKLIRMAKITDYSHLDDVKERLLVHEFSLKSNCWSEVKPYPRLTNDLLSGSKPTWTKQWTSGTPSVGGWCWEDTATFRVNRDEHGNMESSSLNVPSEEDDMSYWQVENTFEYVESLVSVHPEQ